MPGFDRTGPLGYGPVTGRGFGPCGVGMRRGFGRGFGWGYVPVYADYAGYARPVELTSQEERKILESQLKELEAEKGAIEKRLKDLKEKA